MKLLDSDQIYCCFTPSSLPEGLSFPLFHADVQHTSRSPALFSNKPDCSEKVFVTITTTEKTSLFLFPTFLSLQAPDSLTSLGNSVPRGKCLKLWLFSSMFTLEIASFFFNINTICKYLIYVKCWIFRISSSSEETQLKSCRSSSHWGASGCLEAANFWDLSLSRSPEKHLFNIQWLSKVPYRPAMKWNLELINFS